MRHLLRSPGYQVTFTAMLLLLLCVAAPAERGDSHSSADVEVPLTISPLSWQLLGTPLRTVRGSDGRLHLAYALLVRNSFPIAAKLKSVELLDNRGRAITATSHVVTINNENVTNLIRPFSHAPVYTAKDFGSALGAGEAGAIYFDIVFENPKDVPSAITHRITVETVGEDGISQTFTASDRSYAVDRVPLTIIAPPLHGKGWVNGNGCCAIIGPHRFVLNSINGELHTTEEFAIDWIRLGADNRAFHGDARNLHNWYDYDTPVTSASAGKVVGVLNDLEDEIPGKNPVGLPLNAIAGNHVIVKVCDGVYVEYDHLVPGSAAVAIGDSVQTGQLLGRLGNSGNSDAPHLHFQIMSRPSILDGWAVPFVFDEFRLEATIPLTLGQLDHAASAGDQFPVTPAGAGDLHNAMPLSLDVIEFR